jgi:tetratricopeptide (TPR) repeat protein
MAKISLRVYNKEIDSLIERGDNAEAIAHCKYILKIYPKYIQTYSLLGKAYLESQRDSEGLDIFQRVLSVYPDDFIAHLSLSIIRQGEDNLDAAIFHMERAYEVQPSKIEVQNELRRLYGRRDGVTPPRVRLTRGALVRMYERGELYRQAIAEIQAALTENPGRIDLQVVLCRMFYLAGQKWKLLILPATCYQNFPIVLKRIEYWQKSSPVPAGLMMLLYFKNGLLRLILILHSHHFPLLILYMSQTILFNWSNWFIE